MSVQGASHQITQTVLSWAGTATQPHRFGGIEYVIGQREIGHIHGDNWIDVPFPKRVRDELVAAGRASPHHILPDSGWITFVLREAADVEQAVALLKQSYDLTIRQKSRTKMNQIQKGE